MTCWCNGECPHIAAPAAALKAGNMRRATVMLRTALTAAPYCPEANLQLAGILGRTNHAQAAETHIERARRYGDPARVAYELGSVLRTQMKTDEALPAFHQALELAPDNPNVAAGYIGTVEMAGDLKAAATLATAARTKFPGNSEVRRAAATVTAGQGDYAVAVAILESGGDELSAVEYLERGRYLEKLGEYSRAWADFATGKTIAREKLGHRYNPEFFRRQFSALAASADPARWEFVRTAPPLKDGPSPIFICGFPRSGTTITETILSAHSAVVAGDELMGMGDVIEAMPAFLGVRAPYPAALIATSLGENADMPALLRDLYMRGAERRIGWTKNRGRRRPKFFTDKMPLNELHLPLIRMLFPAATVFRMERHPLDVMVSCMSQWLAHGGYFGSSLEAAALHYRACDEIVHGYKKPFDTLGLKFLTPVAYESLVENFDGEVRAMLDELGLPFEPRCLSPHKNPRLARTLSYAQVKKPFNGDGVGRWKNFRDHLAPAVEILRPILERDGYDF